jgi:alkyl sulfatase BDS1-like metallo-beta-lactamase superfamily hydrolase
MTPRTSARAALALLLAACGEPAAPPPSGQSAHAALAAHSAEFERRVYSVTDGVHVAVGFALANSILVEGDACDFVVDVTGSVETAREVRAEFEKITSRPIGALVYTHNHADHVFGGRGFVPEGEVEVYAHETTQHHIDRVVNTLRPVLARRATRMFGTALPKTGPDAVVNDGIGLALEIDGTRELSLLPPNRTFADELRTQICGVAVELVHAPGETDDQIFVWLPERRALLPGDNVYKAFPNLYTIRGTSYRDVLAWARSLDRMRALEPEHLVPSHTRPVSGRGEIASILTAYRDAIQFVHDQTIRGMNLGLGPDELVAFVRLPPHLAGHPWLQELYGTVEWSVRSVFAGQLGWFDGDAATLWRAPPGERAAGFAELAGGREALARAAERALDEGRLAWGAELAAQLVRLDPQDVEARRLEARALRELAARSTSPNGRNYALTQALELEGAVEIARDTRSDESVAALVASIPIRNFMQALPVNLDAQAAAQTDLVVGFRFPDVGEDYTLHVRRGVAELRDGAPERPDASLVMPSRVWREILTGRRNAALALASREVEIEGSALDLVAFLRLFQAPD